MKPVNFLFSLLILVILISSCKKSDRDEDTNTNSALSYATGQSLAYDIFKTIHQAANSSKGISSASLIDSNSVFGCDTLIVDTLSNPMSITIQYNTNCTGIGIVRNGKVSATFNSKYDVVGCRINISFSDLSLGALSVASGSMTCTYNGLINLMPDYTCSINNLSIKNNNGNSSVFSGVQRLSISTGSTTASVLDDVYNIKGNANGTTYEGNNFTATIQTDLRLIGNCYWISSGTVNVIPDNKATRSLNFGSVCDNSAKVSVNGVDYDIVLP